MPERPLLLPRMLAEADSRDTYVGGLKDGKGHGKGTYTHASGETYVGEFKDGIKHGAGTLTMMDGRKYVGKYKENVPHGFGTGYFADGTIDYQGEWENGERVHAP